MWLSVRTNTSKLDQFPAEIVFTIKIVKVEISTVTSLMAFSNCPANGSQIRRTLSPGRKL